MRTFIFKDELKSISRTYGGSKHECTIYEIKRNKPVYIGRTVYHTSSTKGAISEVNAYLLNNKIIPKTWSKRPKQWGDTEEMELTEYYDHGRYQDKYKIIEI